MIIDKSVDGSSKLLSRKWHDSSFEKHKHHLALVKPTLNMSSLNHLQTLNKKKGGLLEEERFTEIE
jgi:hypothetical protein